MQSFDTKHQANDGGSNHLQIGTGVPSGFTMPQLQMAGMAGGFTTVVPQSHMIK